MAGMSMAFFEQVMGLPLNPKDRNFDKILRVKQAASQAIMTIMARVNTGQLREQKEDGLAELLASLDGEKQVKADPVLDGTMDPLATA